MEYAAEAQLQKRPYGGRRRINDQAATLEAWALYQSGEVPSIKAAARKLASQVEGNSLASNVRRLEARIAEYNAAYLRQHRLVLAQALLPPGGTQLIPPSPTASWQSEAEVAARELETAAKGCLALANAVRTMGDLVAFLDPAAVEQRRREALAAALAARKPTRSGSARK